MINLEDLDNWFHARIGPELESLREDAKELWERLQTQTDSFCSASEALLYESEETLKRETGGGKYRAGRSARRLSRDIVSQLEGVTVPEGISYNELKILSSSLARTISDISSARQRWESQTTPFFILATMKLRREYDRLVELNRELKRFVDDDYDRARRIEDTARMIEEMKKLSVEAEDITRSEEKKNREIREVEKRLELAEGRLSDLEKNTVSSEIRRIEETANKTRRRISLELRSLRRPLKKLKFLVKKGRLDVGTETVDLLRKSKEEIDVDQIERMGVRPFRLLMETTREAVNNNRLSLKKEERTRVIRALNAILDERLVEEELDRRRFSRERKETLLSSEPGRAYQKRKTELERVVEKLREERLTISNEKERLKNEGQEKIAEIEDIKNRIEEDILELIGEEVDIRQEDALSR